MTDPVFLEVEDVLLIHEEQLGRYGGAAGVRDQGLLESAIAMPRATAGGEFAHEDVYATAAAPPTRKTSAAKGTSRGRTPRATASSPKQSARVPSPSGWCEAYVVEWSDDNSQVMLEFDGGACGAGAVSAFGKAPGLQLRWLDPTTVEVQHSVKVRMDRNASGEAIQCGGPHRRVRVVLKAV